MPTSEFDLKLVLGTVQTSAAVLDQRGVIVEVSEGWKAFADNAGLKLSDYGLGTNYLQHCVFSDPTSVGIMNGIGDVLERRSHAFSTIYPCHSPGNARWFMLHAFAIEDDRNAALLLHLDVSELLKGKAAPLVSMAGIGGAYKSALEKMLRKSSSNALGNDRETPAITYPSGQVLSRLTRHQLKILSLLARGASNADIAVEMGIAVGSAKAQAAALVRRLGLRNRTEAAVFAAARGLGDSMHEN